MSHASRRPEGRGCWRPGRPSGLVSPFQPQQAPAASCPCARLLGWAEGGGTAQGQGLAGVDSVFQGPPPRATSKVRLSTAGALGFLRVTAPEAPLVAALRAWGQAVAWLLLPESPSHLSLNIPGLFSNVSHLGANCPQPLVPGGEGQAEATPSLAVPGPAPAASRRGSAGQTDFFRVLGVGPPPSPAPSLDLLPGAWALDPRMDGSGWCSPPQPRTSLNLFYQHLPSYDALL